MPVFELDEYYMAFPHPELANPDGLLAIGGKMREDWLLLAYENGIFPWYNDDTPPMWWSPDPRYLILPEEIHVQKSMRPYLNNDLYRFAIDTDFEKVIQLCAEVKGRGKGRTWITDEVIKAYTSLHRMGLAHSAEIWKDDQLLGGLYGVSLGGAFFGESMFSLEPNISKLALIRFGEWLSERDFKFIDCQIESSHLARMGAKPYSRADFLELLGAAMEEETFMGCWRV
jgi:leucyl/phenylalanyl-tRNA--protein transferase